jgi:NADP-dependent 3-hydroxy acid dehydrogenase YdfG
MKYEGSFEPTVCSGVKRSSKTVIIAGGTGMIGSKVARSFYLAGWNV